jgi:lipopolysaccharide/colanic/teichoic acid biosynthesis glycosyltransferase
LSPKRRRLSPIGSRLPERRHREPLGEAEFVRTVARELARTERSGEALSMMVLDTTRALPQDLETLLDYLQGRLRLTDEIGWLQPHFFAVLLPATTGDEAATVAESISDSLGDAQARITWQLHSSDRDMDVFGPSSPRNGQDSEPPPPSNGHHNGNGVFHEDDRSRVSRKDMARQHSIKPLATLMLVPLPAGKRAMDVAASLFLLIIASPLLLIVALAIKLESRGAVLFRQPRVGQGGRVFMMLKFRTMVHNAEELLEELQKDNQRDGPAFKVRKDPRVTRVGRLIRGNAIDELPQLWNVLMGDMTMVGPRPHLPREVVQYEAWHKARLRTVSGLTCIWQVDGRLRNVSFADWVRQDIRYGTQFSARRDLGLMFRTAWQMVFRHGDH